MRLAATVSSGLTIIRACVEKSHHGGKYMRPIRNSSFTERKPFPRTPLKGGSTGVAVGSMVRRVAFATVLLGAGSSCETPQRPMPRSGELGLVSLESHTSVANRINPFNRIGPSFLHVGTPNVIPPISTVGWVLGGFINWVSAELEEGFTGRAPEPIF